MLEISFIKLIFDYLSFSLNTFPKIKQKLGGQLEVCLSVYVFALNFTSSTILTENIFRWAHTVNKPFIVQL